MLMLLGLLSLVIGVGSIICWILVLMKMFPAEGPVKGVLAIICALYALVWGWQHKEQYGLTKIVQGWTALIIAGIVINVLRGMMANHG